MNLEFTNEEKELARVARKALAGRDTLASARAALDGDAPPDLWELAVQLGWPGVLVTSDEETGGTLLPGLAAAMLLHIECGRALASTGLPGHAAVLAAFARHARHDTVTALWEELVAGTARGVFLPAVPGSRDGHPTMQVDERPCAPRGELPAAAGAGRDIEVTGRAAMVPGVTEDATLLVPVRCADGTAGAALVDGQASGVKITTGRRYDMTTSTGSVDFEAAPATMLPLTGGDLRRAWDVMQVLLSAEALGVCEATLDMGVDYAKRRRAFGRPIGTFQAIKHQLTDVYRQAENVRSLLCFSAVSAGTDEFSLACSCARLAADRAAESATRACLAVHGAIGVTWEHDAHLYFRRAESARLLLGGQEVAAGHIVGESHRLAIAAESREGT
ncbi:MAG TPA: acyl-CoA dehydrogenase family protein [Streptosporangiaceae bacterium]|nr:acyl-CoA dehydrogenase family protein [Streptosporangiaceae bacterium]